MSSGSARELRLSDAERELAVGDLKEHCAAGRLSLEDLPERVALVYRATTNGDLAESMGDLPDLPRPAPSSPRSGGPSRRPRFLAEALKDIAPPLTRFGYAIALIERDRIIFERSVRPAWTILLAIVTFPLGLVALLVNETEQLTVAVEGLGEQRTGLTVHGKGPLPVRRAVAELRSG